MASSKCMVFVLIGLTGCTTLGVGGPKPVTPVVVDPTLPVVQTPANLLDSLAGGLIGQKLGTSFDKSDRAPALEAEYKALEQTPAGQAVTWKNAKNGHGGSVIAAQPYSVGSQNCRQYSHSFTVGPTLQTAKGTACRATDGSWTPLT